MRTRDTGRYPMTHDYKTASITRMEKLSSLSEFRPHHAFEAAHGRIRDSNNGSEKRPCYCVKPKAYDKMFLSRSTTLLSSSRRVQEIKGVQLPIEQNVMCERRVHARDAWASPVAPLAAQYLALMSNVPLSTSVPSVSRCQLLRGVHSLHRAR